MLTLLVIVSLYTFRVNSQPENRYAVVAPSDFRGADKQFLPEQMIWARPLIKTLGCVFSQNAIRFHIQPTPVGFEPCGIEDQIKVTLSDDLIDVTVTGVAMVNGTKRPFSVTLQHYPPSTDESGFQITSLNID